MKKFKALLVVACALLLVAASVFGTMAYLTSTTGEVKNTFTVGNVAITLDEAKVNVNGNPVDANGKEVELAKAPRVAGNQYKLIPSHEYTKDPTVHVTAGSEDAYVRMNAKVNNLDNLKAAFPADKYPDYYAAGDVFLLEKLVNGWESSKWESKGFDANTATYEFRYTAKATAGADLPALFTSIVIPGTVDKAALENLGEVEIVITADAIQAEGFTNANDAWAAFN